MLLFKILWGLNVIPITILIYYLFIGIGDGSVNPSTIIYWLIIFLGLAVIMLGSIWLKSHNHLVLSICLLLVLTIPSLFYLFYASLFFFGNGRVN